MVQLSDALTLDTPRRSSDGYVRVRARSARAGVYDYLGIEVDPEGKRFKATDTVKVYRPAEEVFDKASLASFALRPITDDHPTVPVAASNWRDHARGTIIGAVKDGEYVGFDLAFMDADTVSKLDSGKRELSNGYSCDLSFEDGTAPDGTAYQAVQRNIRGNHVALVDRGRAGPECRVKDSAGRPAFAVCDANPAALSALTPPIGDIPMKTLTIDGLRVPNVSDEAEAAIVKLQADAASLTGKLKDAEDKNVADAASIVAKDAEIADLKAKLADAAITPAKLADAAKEYADVKAKATALGVAFGDDADTAAIKKAVVDEKMGDAAKAYTADHIAIAFDALTKDAKVEPTNDAFKGGITTVGDADKAVADARAKMIADMLNPAAVAA